MKRTIAILLFLTTLVIMLLPNATNAASGEAQVKITADNTLVEVGDTVKITVTQYQKGTSELRASKYVEFKLSYNKEIFSYEGITEGFNATDAASNGNIENQQLEMKETLKYQNLNQEMRLFLQCKLIIIQQCKLVLK